MNVGMISRFSSRQGRLDHVFLRDRLRGAATYDRIAGYFRSSFFELVHEEIPTIGRVRIVCNSELDPEDVTAAGLADVARERALLESWNRGADPTRAPIEHGRWVDLHKILTNGNVEVRVISRRDSSFLHGKAGLITAPDGSTSSFVGSVNETASGWKHSYEIVWEDRSEEAARWTQAEFDELWAKGVPLPQAVIDEIGRIAYREEVSIDDLINDPIALIKAALVEAPMRVSGETLQPWQKAFVRIWHDHRKTRGAARLLLGDEVGVGKTLSMAVTGALSVMLGDGPLLILCPATLMRQWQAEMLTKLGLPSARWVGGKGWVETGEDGTGKTDILGCPTQIGIVSTGILTGRPGGKMSQDAERLLQGRFGMVILDEGHKARVPRNNIKSKKEDPNNLYAAALILAERAKHMVIGTATPIQTDAREIYDLIKILSVGNKFVLGTDLSSWRNARTLVDVVKTGDAGGEDRAWDLLRNPLPLASEDELFEDVRTDLRARSGWMTDRGPADLDAMTRGKIARALTSGTRATSGVPLLRYHNPISRHVVIRRRRDLERAGLMKRIDVRLWPDESCDQRLFAGTAVNTPLHFQPAYEEISEAVRLMGQRTRVSGFIRKMIMQRICSSVVAGMGTVGRMIEGRLTEEDYDLHDDADEASEAIAELRALDNPFAGEILHLKRALGHLENVRVQGDPKLRSVLYLLRERGWDGHGSIIFSQYYDTALWVASQISSHYPSDTVGVYAGGGKSGIVMDGEFRKMDRDDLKRMIAARDVRLLCATDAACEGLNLQTLGTLVNVDLPWNPSKLEQRIGRIKRFGQGRDEVDMASLVYQGTVDEQVYSRLSERLKENFDILGYLPDTIFDDWVEKQKDIQKALDEMTTPPVTSDVFKLRYGDFMSDVDKDWETFNKVITDEEKSRVLRRSWKAP